MDKNKNIIWLASYPKSGNTWFRAFITNLFRGKNEPADINNFIGGPIASSREIFDEFAGTAASDLTFDEIDALRPDIFREHAASLEEVSFLKTHDAYTFLPDGQPMFPSDISFGAVYLIRNPFDVACSFAHHSNKQVPRTILDMNNPQFAFCSKNNTLHNQLRQKLLSWNEHVKSWTEQDNIPFIVIRFEDLKKDAVGEFSRAMEFAGKTYTREQIELAVELSSFSNLKKMEEEKGFNEKNPKSDSFFREGETGRWRDNLTEEMVGSLIINQRESMIKYGYLTDDNEILV